VAEGAASRMIEGWGHGHVGGAAWNRAIPGGLPTTASNDRVLRFYAVWWAAQGPAAWSLARDPMLDPRQVRAVCATTFLGGLARVAAMRASGRPHPLFQVLTVFELLAPPLLLAARTRVELPAANDAVR
jgi:hypothetical protein